MDRGGPPAPAFLSGVPAIGEHPHLARGQWGGHTVHDCSGPGTARATGALELAGGGRFEVEGQTERDTQAVPGPQGQGDPQDAPHKVEPAQRALFLARRARTVAIAVAPCAMGPGFVLGRGGAFDHTGVRGGHPLGRQAEDPRPELPARRVEGPAEKDIQAPEGLDGRGAREPQLGGEGVARAGQGPPPRQHGEGWPRGSRKEAVK